MTEQELLECLDKAARDQITTLDLSHENLTSLPAEIGNLTQLKVLNVCGNFISDNNNKSTSLPAEISKLQNLTTLDLSCNQLKHLPPDIVGLQSLTTLYLSSNQLTSLPSEISKLQNLTTLDLHENQLTSLPNGISDLQYLKELDIRDNPLPIPPEILEDIFCPRKLINYYIRLDANPKECLNEAKILLVGQGNVGKTSLMKRIIQNRYDANESKTEGINILPLIIPKGSQNIRINVWDFGGQEIMHATHQFFLTKRSLYLLVLDARLAEEENRIEYWLKIIQSFGDESPIIIVGNKIDEHPFDINRSNLQNKYPRIQDIIEISCKTGKGIPKLKRSIIQEVNTLKHVSTPLQKSWLRVKKKLEKSDKNYILYSDYEALCKLEGVTEKQSQKSLINLLHDLGTVLNFQDDPRLRDTHIINPKWVTNGVYCILNDRYLFTKNKGILHSSMLNRILDPNVYPASQQLFILNMMQKFELCFSLAGFSEEQFLIPELLKKEEPNTGDWLYPLSFEYHYNTLHNNIISRFIVRMNRHIHQKLYWRTGVVLAYGNNKALIKSDREDKIISIRVIGPIPGFLTSLD